MYTAQLAVDGEMALDSRFGFDKSGPYILKKNKS